MHHGCVADANESGEGERWGGGRHSEAGGGSGDLPTGAPWMASKPVAFLLADWGVTKRHSRPHCSNDNPDSEAQFKTLKYRPAFPTGSALRGRPRLLHPVLRLAQRRAPPLWDRLPEPADVHYGRAEQVRAQRAVVLDEADAAHLERFVDKPPTPPALPTVAWINQPEKGHPRHNESLINLSHRG
jgi:putative transposase